MKTDSGQTARFVKRSEIPGEITAEYCLSHRAVRSGIAILLAGLAMVVVGLIGIVEMSIWFVLLSLIGLLAIAAAIMSFVQFAKRKPMVITSVEGVWFESQFLPWTQVSSIQLIQTRSAGFTLSDQIRLDLKQRFNHLGFAIISCENLEISAARLLAELQSHIQESTRLPNRK